jgi:hypothetical protein
MDKKKELLTLAMGDVAYGWRWRQWLWWWVRISQADHKSMWQHFEVLRFKSQKVCLNRRQLTILQGGGGGLSSHPTPGHVIRKWTVNTSLKKGHQANQVHCWKFHIIQVAAVHLIFLHPLQMTWRLLILTNILVSLRLHKTSYSYPILILICPYHFVDVSCPYPPAWVLLRRDGLLVLLPMEVLGG